MLDDESYDMNLNKATENMTKAALYLSFVYHPYMNEKDKNLYKKNYFIFSFVDQF
jgi:hypothetical protein